MPKEVTYRTQIELGAKKNTSFQRNLRSAASELDRLDQKATRVGKAMLATGAAVTTGLAVSVKNAAGTYKEFEQEMAVVAGITKATKSEYNQLEQAALDAGSKTVYTAKESASALEYMSLAGWNVNQSTTALMPVLRMATATGKELGTTSDLITDSMGALQLSINELSPYMDMLIAGNNYSNTTAEQLMQALIKTGGAARTVGADLDDTITALGILANNGTKAEEAGTAMNSMLTRMASNSTAIDTLESLNVKIWDSKGNFIGLKNALIEINKQLDTKTPEERAQYIAGIAGTRRYSLMTYLLNAVKTDAKTGAAAWDTLEQKIRESNGSLDEMYDTTTNTLENAEKMLTSAKEDMQIKLTDVYADNARDFISWLATNLPNATADLVDFANQYQGEFVEIVEDSEEVIQRVWQGAFQTLEWLMDNRTAVGGTLKGIAGGILAIKAASAGAKIVSTINDLTKLGGSFGGTMGIATTAISLGITAFEAIHGAIENAERKAVESNLETHFGNIKLSMEDINELAKDIIGEEKVKGAEALAEIISKTDDSLDSVSDALSESKETSWKINAGFNMTTDDFQSYGSEIQNYIKSAEEYAENRGYEVHLSASLLFGNGSDQDTDLTQTFTGAQQKLQALGNELYDYLYNETNGALLDGAIDVDEDKVIQELQGKMQTIVDALSDSKIQAAYDTIEMKYSGADLTSDTFEQLNKDLTKQAEAVTEQAENAYSTVMQAYEYKKSTDTSYTDEQFMNDQLAAQKKYHDAVSEANSKSATYLLESITEAYPDLQGTIAELAKENEDTIAKYTDMSNEETKALWESNPGVAIGQIASDMQSAYDDVDLSKTDRKAISKILDGMDDQIEALQQEAEWYTMAGEEVPEALRNTLESLRTMQGLADGYDAISDGIMGNLLTDADFQKFVDTMDEEFSKSYLKVGANAKSIYSKGYDIDTDLRVKVNMNATLSGMDRFNSTLYNAVYYANHPDAAPKVDTNSDMYKIVTGQKKNNSSNLSVYKNAEGGIYKNPILTTFAEEGPEAAIPLDGTRRAKTLWLQAGAMLGMYGGKSRDSEAVTKMESAGGSASIRESGGDEIIKVVYSPNVVIKGSAKQEDVQQAITISQREFEKMLDRATANRKRRKYGGQ